MEIFIEAGRLYTREVQTALRFETRYISNLYERSLPMRKLPPGIWRILISGGEVAKSACLKARADGILEVSMPLELSRLLELDDDRHPQEVLNVLDAAMAACAAEYGWPDELWRTAHADVLMAGFRNRWLWVAKSSPDRRHRAALEGELTRRSFVATLTVTTADDAVVLAKEILRTLPHERFFVPAIGKCSWVSKSEFKIADDEGKLVGKWSIKSERSKR